MSSIDQDALEVVSNISGQSIWQVFKEICQHNGLCQKRVDALWDAWVFEDYIPEWMEYELKLLITKCDWNQVGLQGGEP